MEPFALMLGYGLVNTMSQLVVRPISDKLTEKSRMNDMLMQMESKHKLDLDAVRINKQIELDNSINIQSYSHNLRLKEADRQFSNQLKMWQLGQFNEKMWPLLTPFDHPSLKPLYSANQHVPISVFMAKTDPRSPFALLLQSDVKNKLSNFLQTTYSNNPEHQCICRIGDWKEGFQDAAFINALWYGLQGQPCIVINPIQSEFGEQLDLNVSLWGLAATGFAPLTQTIITGPFSSAIGRIKKAETIKWKSFGLPASSPEMKHNIDLLNQEEELRKQGKGEDVIEHLLVQYKLPKEIQNDVITKFSREYSHTIACITGMYADIYHLIEYGAEPFMPQAINLFNQTNGTDYQIPEITISHYRKALLDLTCTDYLQDKLPLVYMKVAKAINYDKQNARQIFQEGVGLWINRKTDVGNEIDLPDSINDCIGLLKDNSNDLDKPYLEMVKRTLISINEIDAAHDLERKIYTLHTPDTKVSESRDTKWQIKVCNEYKIDDFYSWIHTNKYNALRLGATEAVLTIRSSKILMVCFVDDRAKVIFDNNLGGLCVKTPTFYVSQDILDENLIEWSLTENKFITNKIKFMAKENFDMFERLGRQVDALVNNMVATAQKVRENTATESSTKYSGKDSETQIVNFFMENNSFSMESESVDTAEFQKIREWITSKLPMKNAKKAFIIRIPRGMDNLICILFSDAMNNGLFSEEYPKKRILCGDFDAELRVFFGNANMGVITLN